VKTLIRNNIRLRVNLVGFLLIYSTSSAVDGLGSKERVPWNYDKPSFPIEEGWFTQERFSEEDARFS
jgi:hypothetical protein